MEDYDNNRDKMILRYAGLRSAREISDLTGLDEDDVLTRKNELLQSIDILTVDQERLKFTMKLREIADYAEDQARGAEAKYISGLLNTSLSAISQILKQNERLATQDSGAIEKLNALRVRELLRLFDVIVDRGSDQVALTHGIPKAELLEIFQGHIVAAAQELDQ